MICKDFVLIIPATDPLMDANGNIVHDETPIMLTIVTINAIVYFLPHILMAVSLFTIALRRNLPCPWLAWLPFANYWVLGTIADDYRMLKTGRPSSKRKWLAAAGGAAVALMVLETAAELTGFPVVSAVCLLLLLVAVLILNIAALPALFDLYESCRPKISVLLLVLSVLLWFLQPLLVFLCRKKDQGIFDEK